MMEACQVLTFDLPEIEGVSQAVEALPDQVVGMSFEACQAWALDLPDGDFEEVGLENFEALDQAER